MFGDFYRNKSIVVTGHTGFKGGWLSLWLKTLGASVWGLALDPPTDPNFYEIIRDYAFDGEIRCDIRHCADLERSLQDFRPDLIFHLAAQPLVRQSYADPLATVEVNTLGAVHVMEALRRTRMRSSMVVVTTDKCYENRGWEYGYRETDPLGGHDVYSASKAAADLLAQSWHRSFFLPDPELGNIATARAGNVIGGGDYGADRIVPDAFRALMKGEPVPVRNPSAIRPWQHVLECAAGYLALGAALATSKKGSDLCSPFNFGPDSHSDWTVEALVNEILRHWPGQWRHDPPPNAPHEAARLRLCGDKALARLGWFGIWSVPRAVEETVFWLKERHLQDHSEMLELSLGQIDRYVQDARARQAAWTA